MHHSLPSDEGSGLKGKEAVPDPRAGSLPSDEGSGLKDGLV